MVYAVIFAGGVGTRMNSSTVPKQFIKVEGKPIIIRTLENFSKHPEVDGIVIAGLAEKLDYLKELIEEYKTEKIISVVPGGENSHQSIHNALLAAAKTAAPDDIMLICDGVRPLVSAELITECIATAKENGTAVPVTPSIDSVLQSADGKTCGKSLPRKQMYITQAPQGYSLKKIMSAHKEAERRGIDNPISSAELLIELGERVRIFQGERENIKVTTQEDLKFLRSRYYYKSFQNFAREELNSHGL